MQAFHHPKDQACERGGPRRTVVGILNERKPERGAPIGRIVGGALCE